MKLFVFLSLVALALAAPQQRRFNSNQDVQLLRYENDSDGYGNYNFVFEQSDGTKHQQQGELKNAGRENEALVSRGSYSWVDPNGVQYTVTYVADENGYQPQIEQGPGGGVPPAVIASLLG